MKQEIEELLARAVSTLVGSALPGPPPPGSITIERTRDPQHGDFATNAAMRLAKAAGCKPRELAQKIVAAMPASPLVARTEIAGAGFINLFLTADAYGRELAAIHERGERYGRSAGEGSLGRGIPATGRSEGTNLKRVGGKEYISMVALRTDENFISNLQLQVLAGRDLPMSSSDTVSRYVLLNESAAKALGFKDPANAVGQFLASQGNDSSMLQVAGVVGNFHLGLDHDGIVPLVLQNIPHLFRFVNVRVASADLRSTVSALEKKWRTIDPSHPFKYEFFDDQLAAASQGLFDIVSILGYMAFIAVSIACLGMLGMATYTTERRVKEVGIRKTLGAKEIGIVMLLSKEFIRVLVIAILIAAPLSYFLNSLWLNKFPNRVTFGAGTIIVGILILLMPGLISIGSQTLRAARRNPVAALRSE